MNNYLYMKICNSENKKGRLQTKGESKKYVTTIEQ